ncbi:MAG: DUF4402 domain-containing protein [Bacteroidetes bacterium]|nr:DUF4402 domain-containing protein [Bacteroidota bacterium]
MPPIPISLTVSTQQHLDFGSFCITGPTGGTITVSNTGVRTATGDISLIGSSCSVAIFIVEVPVGTSLITVLEPDTKLSSNNGESITLHTGTSEPAFPYTTISGTTEIQVGGTLTVKGSQVNPPGNYRGDFEMIVNNK